MPKKLRRFLISRILFVVWLSFITGVFEAVGAPFAADYFSLIVWALRFILFLVICAFAWRFYTGVYRDFDLLFDND